MPCINSGVCTAVLQTVTSVSPDRHSTLRESAVVSHQRFLPLPPGGEGGGGVVGSPRPRRDETAARSKRGRREHGMSCQGKTESGRYYTVTGNPGGGESMAAGYPGQRNEGRREGGPNGGENQVTETVAI